MIYRTKDGREYGEWSSSAVQGLETVAQRPWVHWKEFWAGPFAGKGRWPNADGRTARLVDPKGQWLGEETAFVWRGIVWSRRGEVLLRWGLRRREIRHGEGTSREIQKAPGRLLCWQGLNAEISRSKRDELSRNRRGERECVDRRVMLHPMSGGQNRRGLSRTGLLRMSTSRCTEERMREVMRMTLPWVPLTGNGWATNFSRRD